MASVVSISNEALAEISADAIESLDERSVSAVECSRAFDNVLTDILARHDWEFNRQRIAGQPLTNDRTPDWSYAYAMPAQAARVLRVIAKADAIYPEFPQYQRPWLDPFGPLPFLEVGDTIYCNVADATLEYAAQTVEVARIPALIRRAIAMELAARIAFPIKKDRTIKGDMIQQAELALQRAIAEDENRNPQQQTEYVSEVEKARMDFL